MTEAQRPDSTGTRANRVIRAPRGATLSARSWLTEAPLRMIMNNLDPEVAERPEDLVVYGGIGKAARNWECYEAIVATLRRLVTLPVAGRLADAAVHDQVLRAL